MPLWPMSRPLSQRSSQRYAILWILGVYYVEFFQFYPARQKVVLKGDKKGLANEVELSAVLGAQLKEGELQVKDLGAQISWRTVFLVEYVSLCWINIWLYSWLESICKAGPLLIHPLFYYFPKFWYGKSFEHSALQKFVFDFCGLLIISDGVTDTSTLSLCFISSSESSRPFCMMSSLVIWQSILIIAQCSPFLQRHHAMVQHCEEVCLSIHSPEVKTLTWVIARLTTTSSQECSSQLIYTVVNSLPRPHTLWILSATMKNSSISALEFGLYVVLSLPMTGFLIIW